VAIDVDEQRLELATRHGASLALNPHQADDRQLRAAVRRREGDAASDCAFSRRRARAPASRPRSASSTSARTSRSWVSLRSPSRCGSRT
jgi:threonine dehydrogenase-like Zn-dependent dehydrogenase